MCIQMIFHFAAIIWTSNTTEIINESDESKFLENAYIPDLFLDKSVERTDTIFNGLESESSIFYNTENLPKEDCDIKDIFSYMRNMSGMQYAGFCSFIMVVVGILLFIIRMGWKYREVIKSLFDFISFKRYRSSAPAPEPQISNFDNRTQEFVTSYQIQRPSAPTTPVIDIPVISPSTANNPNFQTRLPQCNVSMVHIPLNQSSYNPNIGCTTFPQPIYSNMPLNQSSYNPNIGCTTFPQPIYSNMPLAHISIPLESASELSASEFVRKDSISMSKRENPGDIKLERSSDIRVSKQSITPSFI
ncbi:hypothetical protein P3W45_000788 [Vairimorpha bombi]|jgi:hypothetical protein